MTDRIVETSDGGFTLQGLTEVSRNVFEVGGGGGLDPTLVLDGFGDAQLTVPEGGGEVAVLSVTSVDDPDISTSLASSGHADSTPLHGSADWDGPIIQFANRTFDALIYFYFAHGVPSNSIGADNSSWALSDNGHIYYKTGGSWVQKV